MAEDLELFDELCRDLAILGRSYFVAEQARGLHHDFLFYIQAVKVPHPFLAGKTMGSSQEEPLRRRMIEFLSTVLE